MRLITGNSNNFFTTPQLDTKRKRRREMKGFKKKKKKKKTDLLVRSGTDDPSRNSLTFNPPVNISLPLPFNRRCNQYFRRESSRGRSDPGGEYRRSDLRVARSSNDFASKLWNYFSPTSFQSRRLPSSLPPVIPPPLPPYPS